MNLLSQIPTDAYVPDIIGMSEHMCVPFEVQPLNRARLLWLNERWFLRAGVNVLDAEVYKELCAALIQQYGVTARAEKTNSAGKENRKMLFADRYGGTGGAPHGGSGRCGTAGYYNAKGIGRTPLTPDGVDWEHSNGFLWLDEAIREVIGAEIADAELPCGAIPVIAIIDTGIDFRKDSNSQKKRCAIVVRPNFLRPAHFERSIYFGGAGKADSPQYLDALRTQEAIKAFVTNDNKTNTPVCGLEEMFMRFAKQIGSARAHRLWQGRFLSSNMSIDGAMVDFGSFRAVASWRRAMGLPTEHFGQEARALAPTLDSLCMYFRKYAQQGHNIPNPKLLMKEVEKAIDQSFITTALAALHVDKDRTPAIAAELEERLWEYYKIQQTQKAWSENPQDVCLPWIYDLLTDDATRPYTGIPKDVAIVTALSKLIMRASSEKENQALSLVTAQRWFRPRPDMYYFNSVANATRESHQLAGNRIADNETLSRYITSQVSICRRFWPNIPYYLDVLGQVTNLYSTALYCFNRKTRSRCIWLEGTRHGDNVYLFGRLFSMQDIVEYECNNQSGDVGFILPCSDFDMEQGVAVTVGAQALSIPKAHLDYAISP